MKLQDYVRRARPGEQPVEMMWVVESLKSGVIKGLFHDRTGARDGAAVLDDPQFRALQLFTDDGDRHEATASTMRNSPTAPFPYFVLDSHFWAR